VPGKSRAGKNDLMTRGSYTRAPVSKERQSKRFIEAKKLLAEVMLCNAKMSVYIANPRQSL